MKKLLIGVTLVCSGALAGEVSHETYGEHPYDYAIDYCSSRGGLALYTVQGNSVKFSCGNDIGVIITINTD